jgi:hypothetical protein
MSNERIFPTKWPLFEFSLSVWKFHIAATTFRPATASLTYEYIRVALYWGGNDFYHFRLYDTFVRKEDRLKSLLNEETDYTIEQLHEIRDRAIKAIKEKEGWK